MVIPILHHLRKVDAALDDRDHNQQRDHEKWITEYGGPRSLIRDFLPNVTKDLDRRHPDRDCEEDRPPNVEIS
jgi:hypothetical protein